MGQKVKSYEVQSGQKHVNLSKFKGRNIMVADNLNGATIYSVDSSKRSVTIDDNTPKSTPTKVANDQLNIFLKKDEAVTYTKKNDEYTNVSIINRNGKLKTSISCSGIDVLHVERDK